MLVLFSVPLTVLAICEVVIGTKSPYIRNWLGDSGFGDEDTLEAQNPEVNHEDGLKISKVEFKDLIKAFPNTLHVCLDDFKRLSVTKISPGQSSDQTILHEIHTLQHRLEELAAKMANGKGI